MSASLRDEKNDYLRVYGTCLRVYGTRRTGLEGPSLLLPDRVRRSSSEAVPPPVSLASRPRASHVENVHISRTRPLSHENAPRIDEDAKRYRHTNRGRRTPWRAVLVVRFFVGGPFGLGVLGLRARSPPRSSPPRSPSPRRPPSRLSDTAPPPALRRSSSPGPRLPRRASLSPPRPRGPTRR